MKKVYLVCLDDFYYRNDIFKLDNPANRDNYYYPTHMLKEVCLERGIDINTYDYFADDSGDDYQLLFFDIPKNINAIVKRHPQANKILVLSETDAIYPFNWDVKNHVHFSKIFVWHDDWVDNEKYFKFHWAMQIHKPCDVTLSEKTKFCTLISGNKLIRHSLELYSERLRTIRWFEENHPDEFDFYGTGWDRRFFLPPLSFLNRIGPLAKLLKPHFPSYRGRIATKKDVLQKYRFSICYENIRDLPGYMTEKIFDSFFAGCVPVYWGSSNIEKYVPADAFIDRRQFPSIDALYEFMKNMSDGEYQRYLEAIRDYVAGDRIYPFSAEYFADTFSQALLEEA